ncbi:MAG: hypothetical protein IAF58_21890 [Leptolyngbya sp.]|nr:hypothetical protein [Candidatus Melainabacteria bacterium]
MRIAKLLSIMSCTSLALIPSAGAQNWRTPNPNQPNGYRATSAATHFSGSYKVPSQPSNGYHASEARSHAGMSCYTPPSSTGENSRSSRWGGSRWGNEGAGENQSNGGRFGGERGMFGRNNNSQSQEWGEFYNRRFSDNNRNNNYVNNSSQSNYAFQSGNQNNFYGSNQNRTTAMQAVGVIAGIGAVRRFMQDDRSGASGASGGAIGGFERNVDGGLSGDRPGGFDKIYAPE